MDALFSRRPAARQAARLHHRPSVHPTVTATPKQAETRAEVTTSDSGPAATSSPPETRPPWVNPGGISSQWCVTRTIGGLAGIGGQSGEADQEPLPGAQVEPGERLVEQEQLRVAHERPGQQHLLALALRDHPERAIAEVAHAAERQKPVRLLPVLRPCTGSTTSRAPHAGR